MKTTKYMKVGFVFAAVAISLAVVSCASSKPAAQAEPAQAAWVGVYEVRDMPAPNPAGILNVDIALNADCTFVLTTWVDPETVTSESGSFSWVNEAEGILELGLEDPDSPLRLLQVDGDNLRHADGHVLIRK